MGGAHFVSGLLVLSAVLTLFCLAITAHRANGPKPILITKRPARSGRQGNFCNSVR
jgi:hypothetical protein